jgi:TetR/AcrR family transcriptional regulator, transcriptional repressor for nem operon
MQQPHESKTRLLDATIKVVRTKGYNATRVEDVCAEAGVTKGSFFHHFKSKDDLARAAVERWIECTTALFDNAPYHQAADPLDRVFAYLEYRKSILTGELPAFTCFVGTMVQEIYATNAALRAGCEASIFGHARRLEADLAESIQKYDVAEPVTARSLALHMQCVIQGSFILAKAAGGPAIAAESIEHLRCYLELLFRRSESRSATRGRRQFTSNRGKTA